MLPPQMWANPSGSSPIKRGMVGQAWPLLTQPFHPPASYSFPLGGDSFTDNQNQHSVLLSLTDEGRVTLQGSGTR